MLYLDEHDDMSGVVCDVSATIDNTGEHNSDNDDDKTNSVSSDVAWRQLSCLSQLIVNEIVKNEMFTWYFWFAGNIMLSGACENDCHK